MMHLSVYSEIYNLNIARLTFTDHLSSITNPVVNVI